MSQIASILVLPTKEHREALLGWGVCGARPPTRTPSKCYVEGCQGRTWRPSAVGHAPLCVACGRPATTAWLDEKALVLAWDGKVALEGRDRGLRSLAAVEALVAAHGLLWIERSPGWWQIAAVDGSRTYIARRPAWGTVLENIVPALADPPTVADDTLVDDWALAVVLVARGIAERVVLLDERGMEVTSGT